MVRVPRISEDRVQPTVTPRVRVSTDVDQATFGGGETERGVARATSGILETVSDIAKRAKDRADKIKSRDAAGQLTQFENDFNNEAMSRLGENAFTLEDDFNKAFEEKYGEIRSNLSNDNQRFSFDNFALNTKSSMQKRIQSHVRNQTFAYDTEKTNSFITNEKTAGINSAIENPERVGDSISKIEAANKDYAKANGRSKEWVESKNFGDISEVHEGVLDRMINAGLEEDARSYYNENKSEIDKGSFDKSDLDARIKKIKTASQKALKIDYDKTEQDLTEQLFNGELTLKDIRELEVLGQANMSGGISKEFAKSAKEYLKSSETINPVTKAETFNRLQDMYVDLKISDKATGETEAELDEIAKFRASVVEAMGKGEITESDGKAFLKNSSVAYDVSLEEEAKRRTIKGFWDTLKSWVPGFGDEEQKKELEETKATLMQEMMKRVDAPQDEKDDTPLEQKIIDEEHVRRNPHRKEYKPGKTYTEAGITFKFNRFLDANDMDVELVQ